jgi:hypothetical protein
MEACYGGTDVMERSCAVARGIDINMCLGLYSAVASAASKKNGFGKWGWQAWLCWVLALQYLCDGRGYTVLAQPRCVTARNTV